MTEVGLVGQAWPFRLRAGGCCVLAGLPPTPLRQAGYRAPDPRAAPLIGL